MANDSKSTLLRLFKALDPRGISTLWKLIIEELLKMSNQIKTWADDKFIQSVNGKSGNSITINKDDIGLNKVDNTSDSDKYVAHAVSADNADTLDGKHASEFMSKDAYETFESVIATSLNDLDTRKVDKEDGKSLSTNDYTTNEKNKLAGIEEGAQVNDPNTVIDANYVHTDNNYTTVEKNKLSGIETGAQVNTVNSVAGKTGDITLDIININGLQTALNNKQDSLQFTSAPSSNNKVVTQNELNSAVTGQSSYLGTIESISSLSTTAKKGSFYRVKTAWDGVHVGDIIIAEKDNPAAIIDEINWSLLHNEMDTDTTYTFGDGTDGFNVTPSVGDPQNVNVTVSQVNGHTVESNVPANAVFTDTIIDNVAGDGIEVSGDHNKTISLSSDVKTTIANAKTDHTNLGGHKVGRDVPANAEFTDYQTTKEGHYIPVEESASQLSASASGGVQDWEIDVVKGITIKRDSKGHVIGIGVTSGKLPANPNTDYQTTQEGHYTPTNNDNIFNPDTSILRDTSRDIAFIGSVKGDSKGHITEVTTCAVLAFTDAEIQAIVDQATAEIVAEMG